MRFFIITIITLLLLFTNYTTTTYASVNKTSIVQTRSNKNTAKKKIIKFLLKEKQIGKQIAKTAYKYVGWLPYVWGGASLTTGSDCCGFTMCVYAKNKIKIGRTVEAQACQGKSVSLKNALPGDIVVYYGHVGIYAGNNKVIHCPQPGECVKVSHVYMMYVRDIRRIRG